MRSHLPILSGDRLDYVSGSYNPILEKSNSIASKTVNHKVYGNNLVFRLLNDSRLSFASEVSSPYSTYRKLDFVPSNGNTEFMQVVTWNPEDVIPPIYIRPMIIYTDNNELKIKLSQNDGVHQLWYNNEVTLIRGSILALDNFWRTSNTLQSLFRLVQDNNMNKGTFKIEENTGEGYFFEIHVDQEFYNWIRGVGGSTQQRETLYSGILAQAFSYLRCRYKEDDDEWRKHSTLVSLDNKLWVEANKSWYSDNFHADEVATSMKPIKFEQGIDIDN